MSRSDCAECLPTAAAYGTVSASFTIEQYALPQVDTNGKWNGDDPLRRVDIVKKRLAGSKEAGKS